MCQSARRTGADLGAPLGLKGVACRRRHKGAAAQQPGKCCHHVHQRTCRALTSRQRGTCGACWSGWWCARGWAQAQAPGSFCWAAAEHVTHAWNAGHQLGWSRQRRLRKAPVGRAGAAGAARGDGRRRRCREASAGQRLVADHRGEGNHVGFPPRLGAYPCWGPTLHRSSLHTC